MAKFVALLRGIGPGNPNMRGAKLAETVEKAGFSNAKPVISSGNVVFESIKSDARAMESALEAAWPSELGFTALTIVKSQKELVKLQKADPFKGLTHGKASYLLVSFFKEPVKLKHKLPYQPPGKPYKLLALVDNALFTVTDNTVIQTTDLMAWLEKEISPKITSRTWLTLLRILKKMD